MLPVKSLKIAAVVLVGALGSAYALQQIEPRPSDAQRAAHEGMTRPSVDGDNDVVSGALMAAPRRNAAVSEDTPLADTRTAALDDAVRQGQGTDAPELRFGSAPAQADVPLPAIGPADDHRTSDDIVRDVADPCAPQLALTAGPAATIELALDAPCHAGAVVRIEHAGMEFDEYIGADGALALSLPAFAPDARITATVPEVPMLSAALDVPDVVRYSRTALQWQGGEEFALHAFHDGAALGAAGHLHAEAPFDSSAPGAFVMVLGDPSLVNGARVQVHSMARDSGQDVRLSIEARQTAATCGRDIRAVVLRRDGHTQARSSDLSVRMDACGARGAFALMPLPQAAVLASN